MIVDPYLLGPLGFMTPLPGMQPAVPVVPVRPTTERMTVGGSRKVRRARRKARTWDLSPAPWSPPTAQSVAALLQAAQGEVAGDLWWLDVAAARANMLFPTQSVGQDDTYPVLVVDGKPRRSLTRGEGPSTFSVELDALASTTVSSAAPSANFASSEMMQVNGTTPVAVLLRFAMPDLPVGLISMTAELLVTGRAGTLGGVVVRRTVGGWDEYSVTYATRPTITGTQIGAFPDEPAVSVSSVDVTLADTDLGRPLNLAVTSSDASAIWDSRQSPSVPARPRLRVTFTIAPAGGDAVSTVPVLAGEEYTLSGYTDAVTGVVCSWAFAGGASGGIVAPSPPPVNFTTNPGRADLPGWDTRNDVASTVPGPFPGTVAARFDDASQSYQSISMGQNGLMASLVPFIPGVFQSAVWVRAQGDLLASTYYALSVTCYGAAGAYRGYITSGDVAASGTDWQRIDLTATAPAGTALVALSFLISKDADTAGTLDVGAFLLTDSTEMAPAWFSGESAGARWLGEPWASASASGDGRFAQAVSPTEDTVLTVMVPAETQGLVSCLGLALGPDAGSPYVAAMGTPCRVVIDDPSELQQYAEAGELGRSDWTVTVREVGVQGVV